MFKACPAVECESRSAPLRIKADTYPELHAELEGVANGLPYDYYLCREWCKRIWRIERYDRVSGETYHEPEHIGYWDNDDGKTAVVYKAAHGIPIRWEYLKSKSDPSQRARNQKDAAAQRLPGRAKR